MKSLHEDHCKKLLEDPSASKEFGVNRDSVLNNLMYFHVCDGSLVPDIMHDVLEGALQYEVKLLLQVMVHTESYITLDEVNGRLDCLDMESKDRPTQISQKTLLSQGASLKQNGNLHIRS